MPTTDYTGQYDPERNPNNAMLRVLANLGETPIRGPSITDGRKQSDPDMVVRVGLECLTTSLISEARDAGFYFIRCAGHTNGTVDATFGISEGEQ